MKQLSLPRKQSISPSQAGKTGKKVYHPPSLTGYGSLIDFTRTTTGSLRRDNGIFPKNRASR